MMPPLSRTEVTWVHFADNFEIEYIFEFFIANSLINDQFQWRKSIINIIHCAFICIFDSQKMFLQQNTFPCIKWVEQVNWRPAVAAPFIIKLNANNSQSIVKQMDRTRIYCIAFQLSSTNKQGRQQSIQRECLTRTEFRERIYLKIN